MTSERSSDLVAASRWRSALKVLAMLAVVTIHISGFNAAQPGARSAWGGRFAISLNSWALFCVPVFVMVSGSLLLDPARFRPEGYLRRRIVRLVPALVFWHVAYYFFIVHYLDRPLSVSDAVEQALHGEMYTALYYFWIALGLSAVAPMLVPLIASRNSLVLPVAVACSGPILTVIAGVWWPERAGWTHTAWTWWYFYLGYFLLGWWLSTVSLSRRVVVAAGAVCVVMWALLYTAWLNPEAPAVARALYPASYYSLGVHVFAVAVFVAVRGVIELLEGLGVPPWADRLLRSLGDATLGVFVLHLIVIELVVDGPVLGGDHVSSSSLQLIARIALVTVVTFSVVVPLRKLPLVRQVL